ncbi:MAG TPA: LysM domain-containing protein [Steroidobacteraceae bacterium]|nr:LysM domain-containing protein [Steroidobacteraceae bacterium]
MKKFLKFAGFLALGALVGQLALGADTDASLARPAPGQSTSVPLAPDAPSSYVVQRGDTLWAIAAKFLSQPWYWPEIWYLNPEINNPHRIYPGDTLRLVYDASGKPHIEVERGSGSAGTERLSPQIRATPLAQAIPAIPYDVVAAFMSKPSVVSNEDAKRLPYLVGLANHHVIAGVGDVVYARGIAGVDPGARYNVVHLGELLKDPDDGAVLGYQGIYAGLARVERTAGSDGLAKLVIAESGRETLAGDRLVREQVEVPLDFMPHAPSQPVTGTIISVLGGVTVIGQYQVVVINRGKQHGLEAGHVLAVWQVGDVVKDRGPGGAANTNQFTEPFAPSVRLPSEHAGTFMVFKTYDRISYGLIMTAQNAMHVGDTVKNP